LRRHAADQVVVNTITSHVVATVAHAPSNSRVCPCAGSSSGAAFGAKGRSAEASSRLHRSSASYAGRVFSMVRS
jgi:hypothetical protein